MPDDVTTVVPLPFHHRVRHGVRQPHNWFQLGRFVAVGASGYIVNLLVFALCVHVVAIDYKMAAVVAFTVRGAFIAAPHGKLFISNRPLPQRPIGCCSPAALPAIQPMIGI